MIEMLDCRPGTGQNKFLRPGPGYNDFLRPGPTLVREDPTVTTLDKTAGLIKHALCQGHIIATKTIYHTNNS